MLLPTMCLFSMKSYLLPFDCLCFVQFFLPSECLSFLQVSLCTIVLLCYLGSLTTALPMMKEVDTDMPHKMWFE